MLVSGLHKEVLYSGPFRPYFFLLNIMRRSSPAFFEKKKGITEQSLTRHHSLCNLKMLVVTLDGSHVAYV
jgi:hypothetical protein